MDNGWVYLLLVANNLITATSQLLLKKAADKKYDTIVREYLNPYVITAYLLMFGTTVVNMVAHWYAPAYSTVSIFSTLSYIFVLLASWLVLKERMSPRKIIGMCLILAGIVIFNL